MSAECEVLVVVILQGDLYELAEGGAYAGDTEGTLQLVQYIKAVFADIQLDISAAVLFLAFEVCCVLCVAADIVEVAVKVISQGGIDKHIGCLLTGLVRGGGYFSQYVVGVGVYHHLYTDIFLKHFVEVDIQNIPPVLY